MDIDKRKEFMLQALGKTLGLVTPACKELGVSRDTFYRWLREDPEFKKKVDEIDDIQGDFVEHQLFKKIKEGSERSILFYMKYKGRKRGYNDELNINANVNMEQPLLRPLKEENDEDEGEDTEI